MKRWCHINHVLAQLRLGGGKRREMVRLLRKGIDIRFTPDWPAHITTCVTEHEALELLAGREIRKLRVIADAAASSKEWTDAHEPMQRRALYNARYGWGALRHSFSNNPATKKAPTGWWMDELKPTTHEVIMDVLAEPTGSKE